MNPDFSAWLAQMPIGPLALAAAAVAVWVVLQGRKGKAQAVVAEKLAAGALVVDVRSPSEFQGGHYPGAVNHPVDKLEASMKKLGAKDRVLVVHCASGARSARAAALLKAAGFTDVTDAGALANLPPRPTGGS